MARKKKLFKSDERKTRNEISTFLRELSEKIAGGTVVLKQGQQEVTLDLPKNLILEVDVEEKHKRQKGPKRTLEIEIEWYEGEDDIHGDGSLELG
jgi:amphi-Trp domain-containing protein